MRLNLLLSLVSLAVVLASMALVPNLAPAGENLTTFHYKVLAPIRHGNLSVFPVVAATTHDTENFLTLDEGLRSGEVVVSESGSIAPLIRPRGGRRLRSSWGDTPGAVEQGTAGSYSHKLTHRGIVLEVQTTQHA